MPKPTKKLRRTYSVFLGLQFQSSQYDRSDIVAAVQSAVTMAQTDIQKTHPNVTLRLEHSLLKLGEPVNTQIVSLVRNAITAVFEVSEQNPNVYFEMGMAYASLVSEPVLLFNKKAARKVLIASDVRDLMRLDYPAGGVDQVDGQLARHIKRVVQAQLVAEENQAKDPWSDLRQIWAQGSSARSVTIVCPTLPREYQPKYAKRGSPEFINLARFGDLDALVEVITLLTNLFPNRHVKYVTSDEVQATDRRGNIVVIGGPDFNSLTHEILRERAFPFAYRETSQAPLLRHVSTGDEFPLKTRSQKVVQDYGLFARFPNPLNARAAVIMIGGLQTCGVLGAVMAFGMNATARRNAKKIVQHCSGSPRFAVLIPVTVSGSQPSTSAFDPETLQTYPW